METEGGFLSFVQGDGSMWCGHCQQDVPAVAAMGGGSVHCARCQRPIQRPAFADAADQGVAIDAPLGGASAASDAVSGAAPRRVDADERYRRIDQTLRSAKRRAAPLRAETRLLRIDAGEPRILATGVRQAAPSAGRSARPPRDANQGGQLIAWLIALIGAAALGAGLGLIGWSLLAPRPELWDWGLFGTLGGQGLLVVGLMLLLANLWTSARSSSGRLVALQNEVLRLQRSTEALTGDRTASATKFYADLARGASPDLLVANLRGQLDELSASLASE